MCLLFFYDLLIFGCAGTSLLHLGFLTLWWAGFSLQWLLLLQNKALGRRASVVVVHGLSNSSSWAQEHMISSCGALACGIFLDQGLNLCLLHWWVDSLSLSHQGSPFVLFLKLSCKFETILILKSEKTSLKAILLFTV